MRAETAIEPVGCVGAPTAPPCTLVIFGATGDLTRRLLVPALYNLAVGGLLHDQFRVIGVSRGEHTDAAFRETMGASMRSLAADDTSEFSAHRFDARTWNWLAQRLTYLKGDIEQVQTYAALAQRLNAPGGGPADAAVASDGNAIFYLAIAARQFETVVRHLSESGLVQQRPGVWRRVVIEKPFGRDLASAQALNRAILRQLGENQVFRIDHFLGKETVQNIMVLRFANGIFEPLWNRQHIDHVQITAAETLGVEGRGSFYDATGALRDMVPNHMFQLLAMCAMEAPNSFNADAVRSEKAKVVDAIREWPPVEAAANSARGQYGAGQIDGRTVTAYRLAPDVAPDSATETYIAMKLMIDNWRWAGVPFYLRTGKSLGRRRTEIAIRFKQVPYALFRELPAPLPPPNSLVIHVQPNEGASLHFEAKVPGPVPCLGGVDMNFRYADHFSSEPTTGYETLIYDCMVGDATLFQRADNIEAGWAAVQPIFDAWSQGLGRLHFYEAGSAGPHEADQLLQRDGRRWRNLHEP